MKLSEIYTNSNTILGKDGDEGIIPLNRWNTLIPSIYFEFVKNKLEEQFTLTPEGQAIPKSVYSSKLIPSLIYREDLIGTNTSNDGMWVKPAVASMMYFISINGNSGKYYKNIELISDGDLQLRRSDMLSNDISENPVCVQRTDRIYVYPSYPVPATYPLNLFYIKVPATPFLDYYIDANYKTQFIDAGASQVISGGAQYRDGTLSGTKTSQTVELEIPESMHPAFQDYLVQKLSLIIGDQYINQVSMAKQQLDESK